MRRVGGRLAILTRTPTKRAAHTKPTAIASFTATSIAFASISKRVGQLESRRRKPDEILLTRVCGGRGGGGGAMGVCGRVCRWVQRVRWCVFGMQA